MILKVVLTRYISYFQSLICYSSSLFAIFPLHFPLFPLECTCFSRDLSSREVFFLINSYDSQSPKSLGNRAYQIKDHLYYTHDRRIQASLGNSSSRY